MWTLQDAKNRFSAVVEAALAGVPQEVTRRGKPAVVVLSADDYRRLLKGAAAARESFAEHLMAFPAPEIEAASGIGRAEVRPRDVRF
ncbi:prevent-host-death family protein [Rhodovulum sulfidophilum]|uniref:type II toxin-antitoxin system Phd/YefM family antitoxin n=1 Tax=Rhodovulum sulfidophilum TaxID=35806 RepID=UPI0005A8284D|nr:type II toxin-antitoxin system Phd/YefM family antitoxin [Rhodovulum sulfidophilum]ANB36416.1 prevent-host-death protein [Rhodovulum sulfidophilum DSM 1374]MCW2304846.1 prevent-host-death family protein [Rhodovulum sulfidophilum]